MPGIPTHNRETYYVPGHREALGVDLFNPQGRPRRCAVLVFHGGGWRSGSVAVQYRLLDAAAWPAPLEDATAALDWVRTHAEDLDIRRDRVVVQGHSAGGHLALMTGTLPPGQRPAAIAAYYPVIGFWSAPRPTPDLNFALDESGRVPSSLLCPPNTPPDEVEQASPVDLLHPGSPPTVIQHGGADQLIDVRSSITLYQSLRTHGVQTSLHLHTDRDHEFDRAPSQLDATADVAGRFIEHTVLNRETAVEEIRRYAFSIR